MPAMIDAWREHTVMMFRSEMFPGGHFFLTDFAASILSTLARAMG
jgi:surfactin synthase thioesterase subunit